MAKIKKLKHRGKTIYPITIMQAIKNTDTNRDLQDIILEIEQVTAAALNNLDERLRVLETDSTT